MIKDKIVEQVCKDLQSRSERGIAKYGTTMERKDLDLKDWLNHQYEELLDAALYCRRAIKELEGEVPTEQLSLPFVDMRHRHLSPGLTFE